MQTNKSLSPREHGGLDSHMFLQLICKISHEQSQSPSWREFMNSFYINSSAHLHLRTTVWLKTPFLFRWYVLLNSRLEKCNLFFLLCFIKTLRRRKGWRRIITITELLAMPSIKDWIKLHSTTAGSSENSFEYRNDESMVGRLLAWTVSDFVTNVSLRNKGSWEVQKGPKIQTK